MADRELPEVHQVNDRLLPDVTRLALTRHSSTAVAGTTEVSGLLASNDESLPLIEYSDDVMRDSDSDFDNQSGSDLSDDLESLDDQVDADTLLPTTEADDYVPIIGVQIYAIVEQCVDEDGETLYLASAHVDA